jgi:translation initiation factor 2B subunit (eIF-2B alpha/beta/delta family)
MRLSELQEGLLLWGLPSRQGIAVVKNKAQVDQGMYVLVPEMRPYWLGLTIAKRLQEEGIKNVYATDNMLGILFYKSKVKEVLFFYKELADQHVIGICGSLYVCLLAHEHNVPIQLLQGDKMIRSAQAASLFDENMRFHYNDVLKAEDEAVPEAIIQ